MFLQVAIILMQGYLSPAFFLPSNVYDWSSLVSHSPNTYATIPQVVKVETYDYHPPMPLPDAESPEQSLGDCAICMDAITVDPALRQHVDEKTDGNSLARRTGGLLAQGARKTYSLAPCHHLFVSLRFRYLISHLNSSCPAHGMFGAGKFLRDPVSNAF